MKARFLLIAALVAGGVYYATSRGEWRFGRLFAPSSSSAGSPLWSGPDVARSAGLSSDEVNNIEIYQRARQATVNVTSTTFSRGWFMEMIPRTGSGSGFIIDGKGHILTNNHVVSGSQQLSVKLADGSTYKATLIERDPTNDLALIQIEPRGKLANLTMGDSEHLQVGQKVLAIGNPFGFEGTLTTGVISSVGRTIMARSDQELDGLIQTDAAINQGNSGGPLLDSQGNVIGINTAIFGPGEVNIGIGFAMPINKAKTMLNDFQSGRRYAPPQLGVSVIAVAGDVADALGLPVEGGLLVQEVKRGSAAAAAGIRGPRAMEVLGNFEIGVGGDLIVAIEGKPVDRRDAISRAMSKKRAGDQLELTLFRQGSRINVKVTLGAAREDRM